MASRAYSIPNLLTYGRILAVPVIVLCFFIEGKLESSDFARWTALWLFIIASLTDFLDGYLARIWNQTSNIGRMLDPIADKLLVASVLLLMAADGTIAGWSLWAAITILCREILVSGLREYLSVFPLPASPNGRPPSRWWPSPFCLRVLRATRFCPTRPRWELRFSGSPRHSPCIPVMITSRPASSTSWTKNDGTDRLFRLGAREDRHG